MSTTPVDYYSHIFANIATMMREVSTRRLIIATKTLNSSNTIPSKKKKELSSLVEDIRQELSTTKRTAVIAEMLDDLETRIDRL